MPPCTAAAVGAAVGSARRHRRQPRTQQPPQPNMPCVAPIVARVS